MMIEVLNAAVSTIAAGHSAALVTVVQSSGCTPAKPGFKMLVAEDGTRTGTVGGGALESLAIDAAARAIQEGQSQRLVLDEASGGLAAIGMACQGGVELFIEFLSAGPEVCIYGAGHVGMALGELAAFAGFRVVLIDDRPELACAEGAPFASATYAGDMAEFARTRAGGPDKYVAIVTRGHAFDEQVLREVLRQDPLPHYIGMMGSVHKVRACFESLRAAGYTEDLITRVRAPIGLPIGGDTPKEIAVSIVSEMISFRYGRSVPRHQGSATV